MDNTYFDRARPEVTTYPADIFINQLGYRVNEEKRAVMPFPCDSFSICDKSGNEVYKGEVKHSGYDENSGDDVYTADFSEFSEKGEYIVKCGNKKSLSFTIDDNIYDKALDDTMKAFYYLRCGCELKKEHAGEYTHPVCHDSLATVWSEPDKKYEVSGGWHDAGDYGRYVTAGAVAVAHLLHSFMMFPKAYEGQKLNIPESDNEMPDVLNECKYELLWFLKMQREDGGVWHKCTTKLHAPFIMPECDKAELFLFDVSSMSTADFAAVCALASRVYKPYDESFSDKLYKAAEKSYSWLIENPDFIGFKNPEGNNTGSYGEWNDRDNRYWAAAELYALTGEQKYHEDFIKYAGEINRTDLGYGSVGGIGSLSYMLCDREKNKYFSELIKKDFKEVAERFKEFSDTCGYGVAMHEQQYCWGSNMNVMKNAMTFIIADHLNETDIYGKYAARQLHYLFGLNALGYSYVSGSGEFSVNELHLRPAFADGIDKCMPGFVSGGPNRFPGDPDAKILIEPGTKPMKSFADDMGCYSLNEVTIYWNSPTVFTLAWVKNTKQ
ncbi:MAG: glycoside hydrolase family 9 protein [Ruminiclostridium sp.]|nr:glycoside hydrolase family 9 protein [Ruminiclostridium sp.]